MNSLNSPVAQALAELAMQDVAVPEREERAEERVHQLEHLDDPDTLVLTLSSLCKSMLAERANAPLAIAANSFMLGVRAQAIYERRTRDLVPPTDTQE